MVRANPSRTRRAGPCLESSDLGEFVGCLVVASGDVDELEAMELVLEPLYFLTICFHFWVVAVSSFHHLVDDELGVTSNVKAPDS